MFIGLLEVIGGLVSSWFDCRFSMKMMQPVVAHSFLRSR